MSADAGPWGPPETADDAVELSQPQDAPAPREPADEGPPEVLEARDESDRLLVDQPESATSRREYATITGKRDHERRPVIPAYLRSRNDAADMARWAAIRYGHASAYHGIRSPWYFLLAAYYSPAGAWKVTVRAQRWVFDADARPLRAHAIETHDRQGYLQLEKDRSRHIRQRGTVTALGLLAGAGGAVAFLALAPAWSVVLVALVAVPALGKVGQPADRPVINAATVADGAPPKLTADVVTTALGAVGIAALRQAVKDGGPGLSYVAPIMRDGPGWLASLDLPHGVTVADVVERREALSAGLRRPLGCVWPEADRDVHEGRLLLWVGDRDMRRARQAPWPLLRRGSADLFSPFQLGTDQRGRPVRFDLMYANLLVGAIPGQGKTFSLRVPALYAALDVRAELRCYELKGTGDLACMEQVAHHYGSSPTDDVILACVESLREVHADLLERAAALTNLPRELRKENKVIPEVATRKYGLHPLVFIIDECQELFSHPDYGKEAGGLVTDIIKRGRALGVILLLATQRPDKDSLPTGVSANVSIRLCHKVMGQVENDMILGTSMYQNGVRATTLTVKDKGIGYLVGATEWPTVIRCHYVDGDQAESIAERARVMRERAGVLSGHAAGAAPERDRRDLLDDLGTIFVESERLHSEDICAELAARWPEVYAGLDPRKLAAMLPAGLSTRQLHIAQDDGSNPNRRGLSREAVYSALEARTERRALGR